MFSNHPLTIPLVIFGATIGGGILGFIIGLPLSYRFSRGDGLGSLYEGAVLVATCTAILSSIFTFAKLVEGYTHPVSTIITYVIALLLTIPLLYFAYKKAVQFVEIPELSEAVRFVETLELPKGTYETLGAIVFFLILLLSICLIFIPTLWAVLIAWFFRRAVEVPV